DTGADDGSTAAERMRSQELEYSVRELRAHTHECLAFIRYMERVDAEELPNGPHRGNDGDGQLLEHDAHTALRGHLVQRARNSATRRIFHCRDRAGKGAEH